MTWKRVLYNRKKQQQEELLNSDKPHNNRVFCRECSRQKQLFETEQQAVRAIYFCKDKLLFGGDTLRAYYCKACGGYHLTHQKFIFGRQCKTDKVLEMEQIDRENRHKKCHVA